ncbi:MAG: flagellar biosynthesis protein [Silanimonas sp.]|nr:MAG: flagellar biosynthesis protein [Silanimonas sp.]
MADKKPAPAAPAAEAKPGLPLVPILGASLGSALLVGGLMFFLMPKAPPAPAAEGEEAAHAAPDPKAQTRYIEVKEPLVVNLSGGGARYLQVQVQLATRSEAGQKAIETHLPAIRSALLVMLRQTTAEELAQPDAMVTLQGRALAEANRVLEGETRQKDLVSALLFTSFVTQ